MKLAIIGSRSFENYALMKEQLLALIQKDGLSLTHIVSGGAKGADTLGAQFAKEHQLELVVFKPDWKRFGKRAGFIRNTEIIEHADMVVAFWDGISNGTKDALDKSNTLGKKSFIVYI